MSARRGRGIPNPTEAQDAGWLTWNAPPSIGGSTSCVLADGVVYVATHVETGQPFALKKITLETTSDLLRSDHSRLWVEHRVLTEMRSRFLLDATYAFVDEKHVVFATRLMSGGNLSAFVGKQADGPGLGSAARFYLASVVLGLECLHAHGICYRDLKAANVLLDACGHARLSDFGLSVDISRGLATGTHGTKGHVAPEQYASKRGKDKTQRKGYGVSPDLWALGTLAYHWSVGRKPFKPKRLGDRSTSSEEVKEQIERLVMAAEYPTDVEPMRSDSALRSLVDGLLTLDPSA